MKKLFALLVIFALICTLASCKRTEPTVTPSPTRVPEITSTLVPAATTVPTEALIEDADASKTEYVLPLVAVKTLLSRNGFIIYSSDIPSLNCTVLLPESWQGKYELGVFHSAVKVYCTKASENTGTWLGSLCTFSWGIEELSENFELSQPGIILKNEEGFYFFIEYASDVQYSPEDAADYLEMAADLDEIQVLFEDATK